MLLYFILQMIFQVKTSFRMWKKIQTDETSFSKDITNNYISPKISYKSIKCDYS